MMQQSSSSLELSDRKHQIRELTDRYAEERNRWIEKNRFFHDDDLRYLRFLVPEGLRVLDLGCGTGCLLAALKPAYGVGVDFSEKMLAVARSQYPELEFCTGDIESPATIAALNGPFDAIILSDTIGSLDDCETALRGLLPLCTPATRVIVSYYSWMWDPLISLAERFGGKMPQTQQNWLTTDDILNLLNLSGFEVIKSEWRQLVPKRMLGLGALINRYIGTLPVIRRLCLRNFLVARPAGRPVEQQLSATVVVPCRNEKGNVEAAVTRLPRFCDDLEILFVEGNSRDGTYAEIERVIAAYPGKDIKVLKQDGRGKGDAVRKAFANARGDVLIILDGDLTTPPEDMPKFYRVLAEGKAEFVNGSRLVYPLQDQAMRYLNLWANRTFSVLFSWLLNQRFTDTLCGTKALRRSDYERIANNRSYFGDFDPFGDFDLIFGAAKQNLKIIEVPVRYKARSYGETQISRFSHGWLLLRMVVFAYRKLKAF